MHKARCSCGQLRVTLASDPIRVSICHCVACQRRTGSVFAVQARFALAAAAIEGESKVFVRVGDEGGGAAFHFCPTCAATVYYTMHGRPDEIAVPVGAFADPNFPPPVFSVYEERMHPWVNLPPGIEHMF